MKLFAIHEVEIVRWMQRLHMYKNKEGEEPWIEEPHKDVPCLTSFLKNVN